MNFGNEYKMSEKAISPDRAALDRMKANVTAQISVRKKPLPLGKIAISCGSVAACAAIVITAAVLLPRTSTSNLTAAGTSSSAMIAEDAAPADVTAKGEGNSANDEMYFGDSFDCEAADEDICADNANSITTNEPTSGIDGGFDEIIDEMADNDLQNDDDIFDGASVTSDDNNDETEGTYEELDFEYDPKENPECGWGPSIYGTEETDAVEDETDAVEDETCCVTEEGITEEYTDDVITEEYTEECITEDFPIDETLDSETYDCDETDEAPEIEAAKFSSDKKTLMLLYTDGTRRKYTLCAEQKNDSPDPNHYFFQSTDGGKYCAKYSGQYLWVYDEKLLFVAKYELIT